MVAAAQRCLLRRFYFSRARRPVGSRIRASRKPVSPDGRAGNTAKPLQKDRRTGASSSNLAGGDSAPDGSRRKWPRRPSRFRAQLLDLSPQPMEMHPFRRSLLIIPMLAGAILLPCRAQAPAGPRPAASDAAKALDALFTQEWERGLREDPERASEIGDTRYNDRWTDRSLAATLAREAEDRAALERLHAIDRASLTADQQLNYDTFDWILQRAVERQRFREYLRPLDQHNGAQLANGITEVMPFRAAADYRNYLSRLAALPARIDQEIALMNEGLAAGNTPPRVLIERVPAQIARQIVVDPERSPCYQPFLRMSEGISSEERAALQAQAQATIRDRVVPAFRKLQDYVGSRYLPRARPTIAASDLPDGPAYYAFLVRDQTTTDLGVDEIHETGLREVARLRKAIEAVQAQVGFPGTLPQFFAYLRSDPKFFHKNPQELLEAYRALAKRIDPELVRIARIIPRLPYGVREIPANAAPDTTTAYYQPGAADGTRPGYYYVNLYKPESRPTWEMMPLTLHEAVPGHHFQFARALELPEAPMFRKTAYFIGYSEGWGLYAEQLGYDMGLYDDPYDRLGQLNYEMWRAVRLVVDTGIHAKGWSRERAIAYFKENAAKTDLDIVNEIDRYIGNPAQALGYKIGQMKISELRARAQRALGPRFDLRDFDDAVLAVGSVPLTTLETHVDRWIRERAAN
jgi:uncharacterized protein (DUF885 family)